MCPIFDQDSTIAAVTLTQMSLNEDLRDVGDVTCLSTIPADLKATVQIVSRETGVVSGLPLIPIVFRELASDVNASVAVQDGEKVSRGTVLASLTGPVRALLTGAGTGFAQKQKRPGKNPAFPFAAQPVRRRHP